MQAICLILHHIAALNTQRRYCGVSHVCLSALDPEQSLFQNPLTYVTSAFIFGLLWRPAIIKSGLMEGMIL